MMTKPISSVKKFYFLDYFYILLKSVETYKAYENVFDYFKQLKQERGLGESKYKKLTSTENELTKVQLNKYRYTFDQVIDESKGYELIKVTERDEIKLTSEGKKLLNTYEKNGQYEFNLSMLQFMEKKFGAFKYLLKTLYSANKFKTGLLIFPIYSPRLLGFSKSDVSTTHDVIKYSKDLVDTLEQDIHKYLGRNRSLENKNLQIIKKLIESGLIPKEASGKFNPKKYNAITKRFRDYWINYFLRELYNYEFSMSSFDLWVYRAKQLEIVHATEFYPHFNGKIVYPTSVLTDSIKSDDFKKVFTYEERDSLYIHDPVIDIPDPQGEDIHNKFVDNLVMGYFDLKKSYRSYFINLASLREVVCYKMKISERKFEEFLNIAYKLNLSGQLKIKISLEVDRLPEETKASYLKQEPVMVDGKQRNIIAIDVTKSEEENV